MMNEGHQVYAGDSPLSGRANHSTAAHAEDVISTNDRTDQEKQSGIENELDRSLREFDDILLRRKAILSKKNTAKGTDGLQGAGNNGGSEGSDGEDGSGFAEKMGGNQESDAAGDESDQPGGRGPASETGKSIGARGTGHKRGLDVPGGGDDDIVARQLREAAEKETDPALKRKLWEEYRNYKKNGS